MMNNERTATPNNCSFLKKPTSMINNNKKQSAEGLEPWAVLLKQQHSCKCESYSRHSVAFSVLGRPQIRQENTAVTSNSNLEL